MTFIVKSSSEDILILPASLMAQLGWHDGDEIKAIREGNSLRLQNISGFLSLGGALADNKEFDEAMQYLEKAWREWTPLDTS